MFNDIQLCSQNSPSIVADTSNSSWFKFVKSIWYHIISISSGSVFQVAQCFQVVQCFSKLVDFLKYVYLFINQHLVTWYESCFLYSNIVQFKFVFSYPQYILYLKINWKTYQFIYCFNSSFLVVAVMVTYTFSLTRKIINLFSLFMALILF